MQSKRKGPGPQSKHPFYLIFTRSLSVVSHEATPDQPMSVPWPLLPIAPAKEIRKLPDSLLEINSLYLQGLL
ncbi:hypothetical protein DY000_02027776 [Brassica cretica]|uniref:Uncharacterized protein n=1 Tax=Brassica cretica TaxID=69181 RepID=A0ABQ7EFB7_BRACR|nr:hypothetical protein DY000_02027776 [Brassica cretica]